MPGREVPEPNAEVRRYFEQNAGDDTGGVNDIAALRQQTHDVGMRVRGELPPIASSEDVRVSSVPARKYVPTQRSRPNACMVWVHGGGWMHGDLDVYDGVARAFANRLGCDVYSIDYGLAPEHPFPFAVDQLWAVIQAVAKDYSEVVLAGDSSGATIAAATALRARDADQRIVAQLLIYPVLESSDATDFKQQFRSRYAGFVDQPDFGEATYQRIRWIWETYVPNPSDRTSPLASPSHAESLHGVAPTVIVTAEHDILRGEAEDYAARLLTDDVPVALLSFPGQIHGFLQMRGVLSEAAPALEAAADAVSAYLDPQPARRAPVQPQAQTKEF